jgi:hypothetical protein
LVGGVAVGVTMSARAGTRDIKSDIFCPVSVSKSAGAWAIIRTMSSVI